MMKIEQGDWLPLSPSLTAMFLVRDINRADLTDKKYVLSQGNKNRKSPLKSSSKCNDIYLSGVV